MKGSVRLRVECLLPEMLIRRALSEGVRFGGVRRVDARTMLVDTDTRGSKRLCRLCGRYSIPVRVVSYSGMSALRAAAVRRVTLVAGIALCCALCALFLGRVWIIDIDFTGDAADRGEEAAILQSLSAMGVRPGTRRDMDVGLLSQSLLARLKGYSYVGARVQGVRLLIEAAPEQPVPPVYDIDAPRDLVSDRDGVVVSAVARSGTLCVRSGDTVRRGQLLIRGEEMTADGARPIAALGEVIVRAWFSGEATLPRTREVSRFTGHTRLRSALRVLDWTWPMVACGDFESQRVIALRLPVGGLFVPVMIERERLIETRLTRERVDEAALKERLSCLALADAAAKLSQDALRAYEIERTWIDFEPAGTDALRARAVYEITTDVAIPRAR